jgi:hypothetical protein
VADTIDLPPITLLPRKNETEGPDELITPPDVYQPVAACLDMQGQVVERRA